MASPLGRGRFAPAAKHRRKKEILKGSHLGCVSAHLQQAEGRAWPAGPAGPTAGSSPKAPATAAESPGGEDAAARRSSPSLACAPSPCEELGGLLLSGRPRREYATCKAEPPEASKHEARTADQSQAGQVRQRCRHWRTGSGHCGRCCSYPRKSSCKAKSVHENRPIKRNPRKAAPLVLRPLYTPDARK